MIANKSYLFGTILHVFLHLEISVGRWSFIRLLRLSDEPSGQDQQHKQGNDVAERKSRPAAKGNCSVVSIWFIRKISYGCGRAI